MAGPEYEKKGIEITALFGSFIKGSETVYSDIDIAIKKNDLFFQTYSAYDYFGIVADIKENISRQLYRNTDMYDLDSKSVFAKKHSTALKTPGYSEMCTEYTGKKADK